MHEGGAQLVIGRRMAILALVIAVVVMPMMRFDVVRFGGEVKGRPMEGQGEDRS